MKKNNTARLARLILAIATVIAFSVMKTGAEEAAAPMPKESSKPVSNDASAREVFERFQALAGTWRGRSTKGWAGEASFRVIAAGSVVVETTEFEAHPGETMMTMYHLDGERLMLTHYCVARNQPRLEMASFDEGGKKATFRFRDATNLATRDQGHMDSAIFQFDDADHFSSRWSFYKNGAEEWMEEIHYQRAR